MLILLRSLIPLCKLENESIFSSQAIVSRGDKMDSFSFIKVRQTHIRNLLYTVHFSIQSTFVLKSVHCKKSMLYFVSLSGHRQNTNELRG